MNQKTFCVADAFCHAHKLFSLFIIKRKKTSSDADHVIHFPVVLVKDKVFKLSKVPTGVLVYFLFFFFLTERVLYIGCVTHVWSWGALYTLRITSTHCTLLMHSPILLQLEDARRNQREKETRRDRVCVCVCVCVCMRACVHVRVCLHA